MTAACPKCRTATFTTVPLGAEASVRRCTGCQGHFLGHEAVVAIGAVVDVPLGDAPTPAAKQHDRHTGLCPEGHGILARARVEAGETSFHIERCPTCHGVFFDAGELATLATYHLLGELDGFFDPDVQRRRREREIEAHVDADVRAGLGEDTFAVLRALAERLAGHPRRAMAVAWLTRHLDAEE